MLDFLFTPDQEDLRRRVREARDRQILPFLVDRDPGQPLGREDIKALDRLTEPIGYPGTIVRYFRDARMLTFPDGTSEVHKPRNGRAALGLDAFR